ncbi:MAG: (Fe-S)-binding protein [Candidatus Promineifilaceae bacterium]
MNDSKQVALCVTCLVDQMMPEVGVATVKLLRKAGYTVTFPQEQTCCGQPFFNSGFKPQSVNLAKRTIEIFESYPAVVLPSGSCTTMIRLEYPHLLEPWPDWHERAQKLAAKTYELSEFLVHQAGWQPETIENVADADPLTYHDSCHMCRMLHIQSEPRQLLEENGRTIQEMQESNRCCGFGGLFSLRMAEVSDEMTAEKLRLANNTNATTLVTADPGCLMHMRSVAGDSSLKIEHLATILAENIQ